MIKIVLLFSLNAMMTFAGPTLHELRRATGDLNQDGIEDVVKIFSECKDEAACSERDGENPPDLLLKIELSDNEAKNKIKSYRSSKMICFRCGGVNGAAVLGTPSISKAGTLNMLYQGGSRFAWTHTIKWRLNKNKEFEITRSTHDAQGKLTPTDGEPVEVTPGDMLIREVNYLAGRISVTVVGKDNKPKKKSCLIPKDYKPARFETFDYREFDDGSDSCSVEI